MRPRCSLLVFTGWPSDGKTSLIKLLNIDNLKIISTDELRRQFFPSSYDELEYPKEWRILWDYISALRDCFLIGRNNVIIDSCSHTNVERDLFFNLSKLTYPLQRRALQIDSYLVKLVISDQERLRRFEEQKAVICGLNSIKRMQADYSEPLTYKKEGVRYLELPNESFEDQKRNLQYLKNLLS